VPVPSSWTLEGQAQTYQRDNVFEAINGAAELYLSYGMQSLQVATLKSGKVEIGLRIFDQAQPLDALGVFLRHRPPDAVRVAAGALSALIADEQCLMVAGRWYVDARALAGKLTAPMCKTVLTTLLSALPGPHTLPAEARLLPDADRVPGSLRFTRESFLGTRDLSHCLHAEYRAKGATKAHHRFVMLAPPGSTSARRWSELAKRWTASNSGDRAVLSRTIPYQGLVVLMLDKDRILGAANVGDLQSTLAVLRASSNTRSDQPSPTR